MYMIYIALAIGAGLILAAQNAVNAQLSFLLKSPLVACFMTYIVGSFLLLILTVILGDFSKIELIFSAPIWMTTGGLFGLVFITSCIILFPKIGSVETVMFSTLGQILSGMFFETFGWFNTTVVMVSVTRIIGIIILLAGTYIAVVLSARHSPIELASSEHSKSQMLNRLWAFGAGILCTVQSTFNGQLGHYIQSPTVSALWAFIIGLIVLAFLKNNNWRHLRIGIHLSQSWFAGLAGAAFVILMSLFILPLGPGLTVSISTLGVMIGAMLIQQFGLFQSKQQSISIYQIIGVIGMLIGTLIIKIY
ncbi:DMT family transporter [Leuconostoc mesenteroides]|nr:DMT family transporter [Leuconostoc mesenteroides]